MSFLQKQHFNTVYALFILWKSRKSRNHMAVCDKNIGYTLSNVTNVKVVLRQSYSQIQSIFCGQPGFVLRIRGFAKISSKYVTSLQSRFHSDLPRHPPVRRRKQTGLSESQRTRAETCFVEERRERWGTGPAHLSRTLKRPGPSGLCVLCAGACWGRTWCGKPDRRSRRWTSSQGPSWLWSPPETPGPLQRLRYRLKRASQGPARQVCVEI